MKCPLRIFVVRYGEETGTGYMPECLKEECAWWDMIDKSCVVCSQSRTLLAIEAKLSSMGKKMPYRAEL